MRPGNETGSVEQIETKLNPKAEKATAIEVWENTPKTFSAMCIKIFPIIFSDYAVDLLLPVASHCYTEPKFGDINAAATCSLVRAEFETVFCKAFQTDYLAVINSTQQESKEINPAQGEARLNMLRAMVEFLYSKLKINLEKDPLSNKLVFEEITPLKEKRRQLILDFINKLLEPKSLNQKIFEIGLLAIELDQAQPIERRCITDEQIVKFVEKIIQQNVQSQPDFIFQLGLFLYNKTWQNINLDSKADTKDGLSSGQIKYLYLALKCFVLNGTADAGPQKMACYAALMGVAVPALTSFDNIEEDEQVSEFIELINSPVIKELETLSHSSFTAVCELVELYYVACRFAENADLVKYLESFIKFAKQVFTAEGIVELRVLQFIIDLADEGLSLSSQQLTSSELQAKFAKLNDELVELSNSAKIIINCNDPVEYEEKLVADEVYKITEREVSEFLELSHEEQNKRKSAEAKLTDVEKDQARLKVIQDKLLREDQIRRKLRNKNLLAQLNNFINLGLTAESKESKTVDLKNNELAQRSIWILFQLGKTDEEFCNPAVEHLTRKFTQENLDLAITGVVASRYFTPDMAVLMSNNLCTRKKITEAQLKIILQWGLFHYSQLSPRARLIVNEWVEKFTPKKLDFLPLLLRDIRLSDQTKKQIAEHELILQLSIVKLLNGEVIDPLFFDEMINKGEVYLNQVKIFQHIANLLHEPLAKSQYTLERILAVGALLILGMQGQIAEKKYGKVKPEYYQQILVLKPLLPARTFLSILEDHLDHCNFDYLMQFASKQTRAQLAEEKPQIDNEWVAAIVSNSKILARLTVDQVKMFLTACSFSPVEKVVTLVKAGIHLELKLDCYRQLMKVTMVNSAVTDLEQLALAHPKEFIAMSKELTAKLKNEKDKSNSSACAFELAEIHYLCWKLSLSDVSASLNEDLKFAINILEEERDKKDDTMKKNALEGLIKIEKELARLCNRFPESAELYIERLKLQKNYIILFQSYSLGKEVAPTRIPTCFPQLQDLHLPCDKLVEIVTQAPPEFKDRTANLKICELMNDLFVGDIFVKFSRKHISFLLRAKLAGSPMGKQPEKLPFLTPFAVCVLLKKYSELDDEMSELTPYEMDMLLNYIIKKLDMSHLELFNEAILSWVRTSSELVVSIIQRNSVVLVTHLFDAGIFKSMDPKVVICALVGSDLLVGKAEKVKQEIVNFIANAVKESKTSLKELVSFIKNNKVAENLCWLFSNTPDLRRAYILQSVEANKISPEYIIESLMFCKDFPLSAQAQLVRYCCMNYSDMQSAVKEKFRKLVLDDYSKGVSVKNVTLNAVDKSEFPVHLFVTMEMNGEPISKILFEFLCKYPDIDFKNILYARVFPVEKKQTKREDDAFRKVQHSGELFRSYQKGGSFSSQVQKFLEDVIFESLVDAPVVEEKASAPVSDVKDSPSETKQGIPTNKSNKPQVVFQKLGSLILSLQENIRVSNRNDKLAKELPVIFQAAFAAFKRFYEQPNVSLEEKVELLSHARDFKFDQFEPAPSILASIFSQPKTIAQEIREMHEGLLKEFTAHAGQFPARNEAESTLREIMFLQMKVGTYYGKQDKVSLKQIDDWLTQIKDLKVKVHISQIGLLKENFFRQFSPR